MNPVVIVGGGLSGLSAGVGLSARGIPVVLLEQRPALGGRAYSLKDEKTGDIIDNGQHVLIAGYPRTMHFLETIGTRDRLAIQSLPTLTFHHPEKKFRTFRLADLPSPMHLLGGILMTDLFSPRDKLRVLRAGLALRTIRTDGDDEISRLTIEQWLDSVGQSKETKRSFWEPLAVSIMNEHLGIASAAVFIRSLQSAFLDDPRGAALAIPTVGLSELYVDPARALIERHGGIIRCRADVVESIARDGRVVAVRLREGGTIGCAALVLAVPPWKAPSLLPDDLRQSGFLAQVESLTSSPIVSLHLWFAIDFMQHDVLGVIGRRIQWVFNKRHVDRGKGSHVSVVISAAHAFVELTNEELTAAACEDLRVIYGPAVGTPTHAMVIREKRATFSCTPAMERIRPGPTTPIPNLFLAGDWTATGYPATIESAIVSGERCVHLAAECVSAPE